MTRQYHIGDRLRIRQWEDMAAEFGEVENSQILTPIPFSTSMRPLCGEPFTVSSTDGMRYRSEERTEFIGAYADLNDCGYWSISADMLEPDTNTDLPEVTDRDFIAILMEGTT